MGKRLSPVRDRKRRIEFSRASKRLDRIVILEVVQRHYATQKVWLRVGRARGGEVDAAEALGVERPDQEKTRSAALQGC